MLDDEEFSGPVPVTEHYQPQFSRRPHRKVIVLDLGASDVAAVKAAKVHSSTAEKSSNDQSTSALLLERERSTDVATVSKDLSFQKSLSDDILSDTNSERHLSTDHYSPSFTSGHCRRTKLSSVDLNVPEFVPVTKEGVSTTVSAYKSDQENTASKNTEMPYFTDAIGSSKQESTEQDQSVEEEIKTFVNEHQSCPVSNAEDRTSTRPAENKLAEDKTIDRVNKISTRELTSESNEGKLLEEKNTVTTVDKLEEEKQTLAAVDKLTEEKSTVTAVHKLADKKSTFAVVDKSEKEKPTFAAVDK